MIHAASAQAVSVTEVATASVRSNPAAMVVGPDGKVWFSAGKDAVDLSIGQPYLGLVDPKTLGIKIIPQPVRTFQFASSSGAVWATCNEESKPGLGRIDPVTRAVEDVPLALLWSWLEEAPGRCCTRWERRLSARACS